jgi:hypothetical protein
LLCEAPSCITLPLRFCHPAATIGICGVNRLLIGFFSGDDVAVEQVADGLLLVVDGESHELSRERALSLREAIGEGLERRETFFRTAGHYRADGSYVVIRRGADSSGNRQVFDSLGALRDLFTDLPATFDADAVGESAAASGSRRHLLVRHFAEHPAFDCRLVNERPLRARKRPDERETDSA